MCTISNMKFNSDSLQQSYITFKEILDNTIPKGKVSSTDLMLSASDLALIKDRKKDTLKIIDDLDFHTIVNDGLDLILDIAMEDESQQSNFEDMLIRAVEILIEEKGGIQQCQVI